MGVIWVIRPRAVRWAAAGFTWLGVYRDLGQTPIASVLQGTSAQCAVLTAAGPVKPSGHYMYRTVVTMCTARWSLCVPHSDHYMYRTVITVCTSKWSLYVPHSDHCMYRTVITICNAQWSLYVRQSGHYTYRQFNIHNSTFCPHSVFMCFVWISEQTAIISLYNINWLVFITETECVYCAVRTGCLFVIQVKLGLQRAQNL
jgi:hypothetical protein